PYATLFRSLEAVTVGGGNRQLRPVLLEANGVGEFDLGNLGSGILVNEQHHHPSAVAPLLSDAHQAELDVGRNVQSTRSTAGLDDPNGKRYALVRRYELRERFFP